MDLQSFVTKVKKLRRLSEDILAIQNAKTREGGQCPSCGKCSLVYDKRIICLCGFSASSFDNNKEYCTKCSADGKLSEVELADHEEGYNLYVCTGCGEEEVKSNEVCTM